MSDDTFSPIPASHTLWAGIAGFVVVSVLLTGAVLRKQPDNVLIIASMAQTIYAVCLLGHLHRRQELVSPLALYSFLMIAHFAGPGILIALGLLDFANPDNLAWAAKAQLFVLIGFLFFHGGCAAMSRDIRKHEWRKTRGPAVWNSGRVKLVLLVFSILGWLDRSYIISKSAYFQITRTSIGDLSEQFHAALRMGEQLPGIAMIVAWIFYWQIRSRKYSGWWWSGCLLWLTEFAYWIPTGRKEDLILTLILPIMVRYLFSKKLPSFSACSCIILFIATLFPAAYYYRSAMVLGRSETLSETIHASVEAIDATKLTTEQEWWTILGARLSLVESVSASVRIADTGTWPLFLGKTYNWARFSIVPRFLWSDKPDFHYGTSFGHAAGVLQATDDQTSVSVTYFGEAYLNFMWPGVVMLFFIGMIFGLIYRYVFTGHCRSTWVLLYTLSLPVVLYIGGTFALSFSGLFQQLVIFGAVAYFMSSGPSPPATNVQDGSS